MARNQYTPHPPNVQLQITLFSHSGFVSKKSSSEFPFACPTLLNSVSSYDAGEDFERTKSSEAKEELEFNEMLELYQAKFENELEFNLEVREMRSEVGVIW